MSKGALDHGEGISMLLIGSFLLYNTGSTKNEGKGKDVAGGELTCIELIDASPIISNIQADCHIICELI